MPTITEVLGMVRDLTSRMPVRHRMPYDEPVGDENAFLLNRTASGLFTLKPNITRQPCLFYGDNDYREKVEPSWNRFKTRDEFMVQNVLREEFELVLLSHPLYRLLAQGIPTRRQTVRIVNPFGNAMAYGFPSPMIPLTSSLDVAAFFATHRQDEQSGAWTPIPERNERGEVNVGVLYMLELALPFPMMLGLSCIGMQAFRRPGRQRLFGMNVEAGRDFREHRFVTGLAFRQSAEASKGLNGAFENGERLTPGELIANKAADILRNRRVSEAAFAVNCKNNPKDDFAENRRKLKAAGVEIVKDAKHLFTLEELAAEYYPTAVEQWNEMFSHVVAVHPGFDKLLEDIRDFPNTPQGHNFFRR